MLTLQDRINLHDRAESSLLASRKLTREPRPIAKRGALRSRSVAAPEPLPQLDLFAQVCALPEAERRRFVKQLAATLPKQQRATTPKPETALVELTRHDSMIGSLVAMNCSYCHRGCRTRVPSCGQWGQLLKDARAADTLVQCPEYAPKAAMNAAALAPLPSNVRGDCFAVVWEPVARGAWRVADTGGRQVRDRKTGVTVTFDDREKAERFRDLCAERAGKGLPV